MRQSTARRCETALVNAGEADRRPAGGDAELAQRAQIDPKSSGGANQGAPNFELVTEHEYEFVRCDIGSYVRRFARYCWSTMR